jgi:N-acetylglucosamine-6-phosphate deacetylase
MVGRVLLARRVVTPGGVLAPGWVHVDGQRIAAVGDGRPPGLRPAEHLDAGTLVPGFVDLHVHGGGGHDAAQSPDGLRGAVDFHLRHGTTSTLISLIAAPLEDMARQLGWVADAVADRGLGGRVLGAHVEGPFLSAVRCGAQNPGHLLAPDRAAFERLVDAGRGTLRTATIAPELRGAVDLVRDAVAAGVVAALGHSDATHDQARAAIDAGASLATHLFNGMRPVHHREPGIAGALLASGVPCEIINDGIHVHPALLRVVADASDRLVLVTDAMAAAGLPDGDYQLGGRAVRVEARAAVMVENASLAGSTLTMDDALRRAVQDAGLPLEAAVRAASTNPARVLGLEGEIGSISPGQRADLVLLDEGLRITNVMASGRWLSEARIAR